MSRHFSGGAFTVLTRRGVCLAAAVAIGILSSAVSLAGEGNTEEQELEREILRIERELQEISKQIGDLTSKSKEAQAKIGELQSDLVQAKKSGDDPISKKTVEAISEQIQEAMQAAEKITDDLATTRKIEQDKRKAQADARKKSQTIARSRKSLDRKRERKVQAPKQRRERTPEPIERRSDSDLRADAQLSTVGLYLPKELRQMYVWSLPFDEKISPRSIWAYKDIVLVLLQDSVLYCVRKGDGVPLWAIELSSSPQFAPAVSATKIYLFVENRLTAIDRAAGQIIWRVDPKFAPAAAPCVAGENLYIPAWDQRVYAIEVKQRERVYLAGSDDSEALKANEYYIMYNWHKTTHGHVVATPTLSDGFLYFGSEDGYVYSVSVDGEDRYKTQTQGPVRAATSALGANLYVGSKDFNAYGLNRLTGQVRWQFPTGSDVLLPIYADAASGVAVVSSSKNGVFGISDKLGDDVGTKLWYVPDGEFVAGVSVEYLYMVLTDTRLAAVEKKSGNVKWMSMLEGIAEVVPDHSDLTDQGAGMRMLCIADTGRHIICLKEAQESVRQAMENR
jgi:outer membrane protein assembly factor BamB